MAGGSASGSESIVGYALETTLGTYVAPAKWLFCETNSFDALSYDVVNKAVMGGTRYSKRIKRPTFFKPEGAFAYSLFPNMGAPIVKAAFGADSYITALTADTVKAATPISTQNGISAISLTNTGAATYVVGDVVVVNTGTASECRQIVYITGNTAAGTVIYVPALIGNAAAAAGTAVKTLPHHGITTAPGATTLPSLSVEDEQAQLFSYKYAGLLVDKFNVKGSMNDATVTTTLFGQRKPVGPIAPTTPNPSANEQADITRPFTGIDLTVAAYSDTGAINAAGGATALPATPATPAYVLPSTTTPGLQTMIGIEEIEFDWSNGLIKKATANQQSTYRAWPGEQMLSIKYKYVNEAKRWAEYDDLINLFSGAVAPIFCCWALNTSLTATENWVVFAFYVPAAVCMKPAPIRVAGDVIGMNMEWEAVPNPAGSFNSDAVKTYIVNGDVTAY